MGVDLNTWVEVINQHPAKWKFDGLDGFYEEVGDAACFDEDFMNRFMEKQAESDAEELGHTVEKLKKDGGDIEEWSTEGAYVEWLRNKNHETDDPDDEDYESDRVILIRHDDKWERLYFCGERQDYDDNQQAWEWLRSEDAKEFLLSEHPPIQMWDHAYEEGVDLDKILFICPGCGRNPASEENESLWSNYFNCGCAAVVLTSTTTATCVWWTGWKTWASNFIPLTLSSGKMSWLNFLG
jgi:hypothetical protein